MHLVGMNATVNFKIGNEKLVRVLEGASSHLRSLLDRQGRPDGALRIAVVGGGCSGLQYKMDLVDGPRDRDILVPSNGVPSITFLIGWQHVKQRLLRGCLWVGIGKVFADRKVFLAFLIGNLHQCAGSSSICGTARKSVMTCQRIESVELNHPVPFASAPTNPQTSSFPWQSPRKPTQLLVVWGARPKRTSRPPSRFYPVRSTVLAGTP